MKFRQVFVWYSSKLLFLSPSVLNFTRFSKSGGAFHHLAILFLNILTLGEQPFHIFPPNAIYMKLFRPLQHL